MGGQVKRTPIRHLFEACKACEANISGFGRCKAGYENFYYRATKNNGCPQCKIKLNTKETARMQNIMQKGEEIVKTIKPAAEQKTLAYSEYPNGSNSRGCIGHLRGDFGRDGNEFWTTWWNESEELKTDIFRFEFDLLVNALRESILKDFASMSRFCNQNAAGSEIMGSEWHEDEFVFSMESEKHTYYLRCIKRKGDYNFYICCYNRNQLGKYLKEAEENA